MYTVRPAEQKDVEAISRLLVQLYAAELPGALKGPVEKQEQLFRFTFKVNSENALKHRYVLCDENEAVVGTGMIQFADEAAFERAPDGLIAEARRVLGVANTLQLLLTVARSMVGVRKENDKDSAVIHSVVVDSSQRGKGAGTALMQGLEGAIRVRGVKKAVLQVLENNVEAIPFYTRLGYRKTVRSPWWINLLAWSSWRMEKLLG